MAENLQNALWCKNFALPQEGDLEITILDTSYTLTPIDRDNLKIIQKKDDKQTEIHACLDTSGFSYQFRPYFYDLPCMIKLNEELILAPGARADLFLTFPIKAQLVAFKDAPHKDSIVLAELKKPKLLKSFYGPPNQGIFCLAIYSNIYNSLEKIEIFDYCAFLPLNIENQYSAQVTITRLLIPPNRLGLFAKDSVLITNLVRVKIKTDKEGELYFSNDTTLNDFTRIADPKTAIKGGAIGKLSTFGATSAAEMQFGF